MKTTKHDERESSYTDVRIMESYTVYKAKIPRLALEPSLIQFLDVNFTVPSHHTKQLHKQQRRVSQCPCTRALFFPASQIEMTLKKKLRKGVLGSVFLFFYCLRTMWWVTVKCETSRPLQGSYWVIQGQDHKVVSVDVIWKCLVQEISYQIRTMYLVQINVEGRNNHSLNIESGVTKMIRVTQLALM